MQNADPPNTPPPPAEGPPADAQPAEDNANGYPIGETGLRQVGDVELGDTTLARIEKEPWLYLEEKGITDETIEKFGDDFGIADLHELANSLVGVARALEDAESSECVHLWRGLALAAEPDDVIKFERVALLVRMLEEELQTEYPAWPVTGIPEANQLGRCLRKYRSRLEEHKFGLTKREANAPSMDKQRAAADFFALAWPILTGDEPTSHQIKTDRFKSDGSPQDGTRFYKAYARVCDIFGLTKPSATSVGNWLKSSASTRREVLEEAYKARNRALLSDELHKQADTL